MKRSGLAVSLLSGFLVSAGLIMILGGTGCGSNPTAPNPTPTPVPSPVYSSTLSSAFAGPTGAEPFGLAYNTVSGNLCFSDYRGGLNAYNTSGAYKYGFWQFNGTEAFGTLFGVSVGPDGTIYVADNGAGQIEVFSANGTYLTQLTGISNVTATAVNPAGTIFYVLQHSSPPVLWSYSLSGTTPKTFSSPVSFTTTGSGAGALSYPAFMTLDSAGNVYVTDWGWGRVIKYGSTGSGPVSFGSSILTSPAGIVVDGGGDVLVAQSTNPGFIQEFNPSGSTYASGITFGGSGLNIPVGLALDGSGNLWVACEGSNVIREYNKTN